jgi:predicted nucleic acid-binding protein
VALRVFDTSALFRRYVPNEPGAERVRASTVASGDRIAMAQLGSIELASILARRQREGALDDAQARRLWRLFKRHQREEYAVVALDVRIVAIAEEVLFRRAVRTADAIHVATALWLAREATDVAVELWTADRRQAAAAQAEGLTVELIA